MTLTKLHTKLDVTWAVSVTTDQTPSPYKDKKMHLQAP